MASRKITSGAVASVFAAAVALLPMIARADPNPGEYKVGLITDSTGALAAAGVSARRGAELAIEMVNHEEAAGKGVTLSLVEKESGSDPARSVQALTQFAAARNVLAVTCCIISPVAGALRPVAVNAQIPMVIYGAIRPGLPQLPYVSSIVVLVGDHEVKMTQTLAQQLKPKMVTYFTLGDNDGFKARFELSKKAMEDAGVKTGGVISVLSNDTDFTAPATQAMATNPDLIVVFTSQTPAAGIIQALRARGYQGHISASEVIASDSVFKKIGEPLVGVPFMISFAAGISDSPGAKAFTAGYQAKFGAEPDPYSAAGYTAMRYIAQGIKMLDGEPTREALARAMASIGEITPNVYGGLAMKNGQVDAYNTSIVAAWTKDGKIAAWEGH